MQGDSGPDFRPLPFSALTVATDDVAAASLQNIARLANGRPSLIVDPGSVGNLCGSKWAKEVAEAAFRHQQQPTYERRPRPLRVGGVGTGEQVCDYDCRLPVALRNINGSQVRIGQYHTPTATSSDLPGLLGLRALQRNRAVLDFNTLQLHFCGPGSHDLQTGLPPETESFQCEIAPSGHLALPCCEYEVAHNNSDSPLTLTLGRVALVLYWAYPPNFFRRRANGSPWWGVVGGCVVFQKNGEKRTIPT